MVVLVLLRVGLNDEHNYDEEPDLKCVLKVGQGPRWVTHDYQLLDKEGSIGRNKEVKKLREWEQSEVNVCDNDLGELVNDSVDQIRLKGSAHSDPVDLWETNFRVLGIAY